MEGLSKYSAKQKAKADGAWNPPVLEVGVRVEMRNTVAPDTEADAEYVDLGKLPELCAEHIRRAAEEMQKAASVALEMERLAGPPIQKQEPRGLHGACASAAKKFKTLAKRAARVK